MSEPKTVLCTLELAREIIADPEYWTQTALAIDNTGAEVDVTASCAYAFCSAGALHRVADQEDDRGPFMPTWHALNAAALEIITEYCPSERDAVHARGAIVALNDDELGIFDGDVTENHAAVLRAFDLAISHA